jgi:hypothetical protein
VLGDERLNFRRREVIEADVDWHAVVWLRGLARIPSLAK